MKNIFIIIAVVIVLVVGYLVINWNGSGTGEMPAPGSTPEAQTSKPSVAPSGSVSVPQTHAIAIQNFFFTRPSIVIKKGDTVIWANQDSAPHTVTGNNGGPDSPTINKNGTYSFTFKSAGTFNYYCALHPSMLGTILVQ